MSSIFARNQKTTSEEMANGCLTGANTGLINLGYIIANEKRLSTLPVLIL